MSFSCRLVVEGEVVHVYHTLQNSRVYHETELDSLEFGLEVIISSVCLLLSTVKDRVCKKKETVGVTRVKHYLQGKFY